VVLGVGFVSPWSSSHWVACRENWDYFIMGEWSLGCLKGQIPFEVRCNERALSWIRTWGHRCQDIASVGARSLTSDLHWRIGAPAALLSPNLAGSVHLCIADHNAYLSS